MRIKGRFLICLILVFGTALKGSVINSEGHLGVGRALSAYSLGAGGINTGISFKADNADVRVGRNDESAYLLSQNYYLGIGIHTHFDLAVSVPLYQDIWGDNDTEVGVGDLVASLKMVHPGMRDNGFWRIAYVAKVIFPTGKEDAGYVQRHSYYVSGSSRNKNAFTSNNFALSPNLLWTIDFTKFEVPFRLHGNIGGVVAIGIADETNRYTERSSIIGTLNLEYLLRDNFSIFAELDGEYRPVNLDGGWSIGTFNHDRVMLSVGMQGVTRRGFTAAGSIDIGLSEENFSNSWQRNDISYKTSSAPTIGGTFTLGFTRKGRQPTEPVVVPDTVIETITETETIVQLDTLIKRDTVILEPEQRALTEYQVVTLRSVNFRVGSAEITPESYGPIEHIADFLKTHPEIRIEIHGYTDATGSKEINLALSQRRAESVANHLVSMGIDKNRLVPIGFGIENPIADNSTVAGRALNRRVEVVRIKDEDVVETVDTEATDTEATESEAADSEATESEETESEETESEETESEETDSEATDSEATDSEETDSEETDSEETDSEETDSEETDSEETDSEETDSEATDSEATDSEETDSEETDSEETDSEATDSEETDSEETDSEETDSEATDSEATDSEATDSEATDSEATDSEATDSEATDSEETDSEETDSEETDSEETDSEETDSEATDSEATDSEETDSEATDSEETDSEATDSEATDSEATDSEATDSEATDSEETDSEETDSEETDSEETE
ncbi:OmpA family protein [Chitinispirillales bacterium ANBcel5]|nr:OmpA family protein [Chitinispirillales bacterium ANBcel5]